MDFLAGPDAERFHILLRPDPSDGALDGWSVLEGELRAAALTLSC